MWETERCRLLIPDPWDVPKINKIGLADMYITRALMETLGVKAVKSPNELHALNPTYAKIKKHLDEFLKARTEETFQVLCTYLAEKNMICLDKIGLWTEYVPDIRVVNTAEECLSCLATRYLDLELKSASKALEVPACDKNKKC